MSNLESVDNAIKRQTMLEMGYEIDPKYGVNGGLTVTADAGTNIFCIKPMGANVVITSCTDVNGVAISALAGVPIAQGDEFKIRLRSVVFSAIAASTCVVCYVQNTR